jgi:hypothetical protein
MNRSLSRFGPMAAALSVLLLVFTVGLPAATLPDCPTTPIQVIQYTGGGLSLDVTFPADGTMCPSQDCVQKITIKGLPAGYYLEGKVEASYIFSKATPPIAPIKFFSIYPLKSNGTAIVGTGSDIVITIPIKAVHDNWPTFEIHVDVGLWVFTNLDVSVCVENPLKPGTCHIGDDIQGWDPVCWTVGCTPGYWKNHSNVWTGVAPTALANTIFGITNKTKYAGALSMLQATALKGSDGPDANMLRQCAAAYVGSLWAAANITKGEHCTNFTLDGVGTPSAATIIGWVKAAEASGDYSTAQQSCSNANQNSMCGPSGVYLGTYLDAGSPYCNLSQGSPAANPFHKEN